MPLDERIRQLSDTIIQEVRTPIEASLHRLLDDVMVLAAADREQAVQAAFSDAAASHESALAALREEHEASLTSLREQLTATHEADGAALRTQLLQDHDAAAASLREQLCQEHETAATALREQLSQEHETAAASLREQLGQEHETAAASLREQLGQERETAATALRDQLNLEHQAAAAELRDQLVREHEEALRALRLQLEQEREAALAAAASDAGRDRETALAALRESMTGEHEAALKAALQAAGEDSERAHRSEIDALVAHAEADREAAVKVAREDATEQQDSAVSARTAAEAAAATALAASLAAAEHAKHQAEERAEGLELERDEALAVASHTRQAGADLEQRLSDVQRQLQDAQDRLRAAEERAAIDADRLREADARAVDQDQGPATVHLADRQHDFASSDRTLAAFRQLDAADSLTEVFSVLIEHAAAAAGRSIVFLVIGDRLRGWESHGFDRFDAAMVDAPVEHATLFSSVIASGVPVSTADAPVGGEAAGLAGVLALPGGRAGLAVPIAVGGRTVAILYADDGGDRPALVPSTWAEIAEILARHAGHRLEVLTVSRAAALAGRVQQPERSSGWATMGPPDATLAADERREEESARRYARLLISEIKLYNEPAVEAGRHGRDLLARLGPEIERARRLFEEKIPAAVRQRVSCFDQEVTRTLAGGDSDLLGQT
jgi:hypothetical protein